MDAPRSPHDPFAGQIAPRPASSADASSPRAAATTTVKMVRTWRGIIRGHLHAVIRHFDSLELWDDRQPATFPLFTTTELAQIGAVRDIMNAKLSATRPR